MCVNVVVVWVHPCTHVKMGTSQHPIAEGERNAANPHSASDGKGTATPLAPQAGLVMISSTTR